MDKTAAAEGRARQLLKEIAQTANSGLRKEALDRLRDEPATAWVPAVLRAHACGNWAGLEAFDSAEARAPEVVRLLLDALRGGDGEMLGGVLAALARLGPAATPAVPKLVLLLGGTDQKAAWVRQHAAIALGNIGPMASGAVDALAACLRHEFHWRDQFDTPAVLPTDREAAAEALGKIGYASPAAIAALEVAIVDQDPRIFCAAARSLADLEPRSDRIVPAFLDALRRSDEATQLLASALLREQPLRMILAAKVAAGEVEAVSVLSRLIELAEAVWDEQPWVPENALQTLSAVAACARAPEPQWPGPLHERVVSSLLRAARGSDPVLRRAGIEALATIGLCQPRSEAGPATAMPPEE